MQLGGLKMVAVGLTVAGGIAISSGAMWQASSAAFTAQTGNSANSWNAGTVALTDDDSNTAMFAATNLRPGSTGEKCITVTYSGSLSASVKMYGTAVSGALSPYVDLVVEEGSGGGFGSCGSFVSSGTIYTGTLASLQTTKNSYANGVGTWTPSTTASKIYKITWTLQSGTPNAKQGASTSATLTWEGQA